MLALVSTPLSAQDRWDGSDELEVNPLACGMMGAETEHGGGTMMMSMDDVSMMDADALLGMMTDMAGLADHTIEPADIDRDRVMIMAIIDLLIQVMDIEVLVDMEIMSMETDQMTSMMTAMIGMGDHTIEPADIDRDHMMLMAIALMLIRNMDIQGIEDFDVMQMDADALVGMMSEMLGLGDHTIDPDDIDIDRMMMIAIIQLWIHVMDIEMTGDMDMPAYDGGMVTMDDDAEDMAGMDIVVVDVPKLIGIGYFGATTLGQQQAAEELGNVSVSTDGPTDANIDDQIQVIDSYITQGVDGILFAANDPVAIAPVLRKALEAGIYVVGYDANSEPDARQWFVNQAEFNGIGKALIDSLVDQKGEDASFGIVTSTFTTPNQARWVSEMWAYASECYPDLDWLETLEAQEDAGLSFQQAQTLINKYGEDLDGIVGLTSVATPASADAVNQADVCEDVAVVGLALPNAMKPYVSSGCVRDVILWNPVDLGYAALYVMRAVVDGDLQPGDSSVWAGKLGALMVVNGSEVLLGPPFVYNMDNIDDFDF